jgi:multicomponent Na+:H+ antiporter subunit E
MAYPMVAIWLISRTAILSCTWWVLTRGAHDSWQVGLPAILTAVFIDYRLSPPKGNRLSLGGFVVYAFYFLKLSITGGIDVAWRTYHPRLPLNPKMIAYPLKLTSLSARNLFVCTVSLLPGTLSAELGDNILFVHVLDVGRPFKQELKIIEDRVAAVFQPQAQVGKPEKRTD